MARDLAAEMSARLDRGFQRAIYGGGAPTTSTASWADSEPLSLERLNAAIDSLPKRETWVVWSVPTKSGSALRCNSPDENLTIIHPDDWRTVERMSLEALTPEKRGNPLYRPSALWIEPDPLDSEDAAAWKVKERARVGGLIAGTMAGHAQLAEVTRAWWRRLPGVTA